MPNYCTCPKKLEARKKTIIDMYRNFFHRNFIPDNKQYWSQCGPQTDDAGIFQQDSELGQMLQQKLLPHEGHFYGVDIDQSIIDANEKVMPEANWFCDDFCRAMRNHANTSYFNPAIIYADFVTLIPKSAKRIVDILCLLQEHDIQDTMLTVNLMVTNPYHASSEKNSLTKQKPSDILIEELKKHRDFSDVWYQEHEEKKTLIFFPQYYVYNGTGTRAKTEMATFFFFRVSEKTKIQKALVEQNGINKENAPFVRRS